MENQKRNQKRTLEQAIYNAPVDISLSPAQAEEERINALNKHHHDNLVYTEPLYARANKRIEMLEAELAEEKSTRNLLTDENNALRVRLEEATPDALDLSEISRLRAELERAYEELGSPSIVYKIREKAAKYDALREKFPFLPGEEFYATLSAKSFVLHAGDPILELKIYKRTVSLVGANGVRDTNDGNWSWSEMYPTAESCRNAIKVEE